MDKQNVWWKENDIVWQTDICLFAEQLFSKN